MLIHSGDRLHSFYKVFYVSQQQYYVDSVFYETENQTQIQWKSCLDFIIE